MLAPMSIFLERQSMISAKDISYSKTLRAQNKMVATGSSEIMGLGMRQLAECLPSMQEALIQSLGPINWA